MNDNVSIQRVENTVKVVYNYCLPTEHCFSSGEAREEYKRFWGSFMARLDMEPEKFNGQRLLDVGCGSCEKTAIYHEWGAKVIGLDITSRVLARAREVIGNRDIELIEGSLFDFQSEDLFDIVISDGVLHHTADTFLALKAIVYNLKIGGVAVFGLLNVWGSFWWFPFIRLITRILGGKNFHKRSMWGKRLFSWVRVSHEGTAETAGVYRSEDSWAYDWFGNPRWNIHSPKEVLWWLDELGLEHIGSVPSIIFKQKPKKLLAALVGKLSGNSSRMLKWYWLLNGEPSMFYVSARKIKEIA